MTTQARLALRLALSTIWLAALMSAAAAQTGPVKYTAALDPRPNTHMLTISLEVRAASASHVDVAMPAWAPGAYFIHNAWRNVQEFAASDETGAKLRFEKIDKQTWRIYRQSGRTITARYRFFNRDYNSEMCYLRGPSVFMYVVGESPYPLEGQVSIRIEGQTGWQAQTGLEQGSDARTFTADSYDTFIDGSILLMPELDQTTFEAQGARYYLVFIGKGNYDKEKMTRDTQVMVTHFVKMMGGAPYGKYVFFLRARPGAGAGGLEHLNSTDMSFSAYATHASRANYNRFLFVAAHEFFHLWNVKRIRPSVLGPFDYSKEQNTRNLYVSEGMTSYWAALGLKHSGLWTRDDYFENLARQIGILQSARGRHIMSVELASWNTWNRSDNAANNTIDYYNKGDLIGLLLDLEIRGRTGNKRSLTDVFLLLQQNHSLPKPGFEEVRGFRDAVERVTREVAAGKADFGDFFARYVSGVEEIPWNDYLRHAGLMLEEKRGTPVPYIGISTGASVASGFRGALTQLPAGQIAITEVVPGSAAEEAGLDVGDVLVAMDGNRIEAGSFEQRFREKQIGTTITLSVFRRDRLLHVPVRVSQHEPVSYAVKDVASPTEIQRAILMSWLAEKALSAQ